MVVHDGMVRSQIQFTEEQITVLRALAARQKRSIAEVVRECVDAHISKTEPNRREAIVERAKRAVGKFSSGKSDVSSRHDDYLADAFL